MKLLRREFTGYDHLGVLRDGNVEDPLVTEKANLLRSYVSHLLTIGVHMEPGIRKLETNLIVDLMLDLNFKLKLGELFTLLYKNLVKSREKQ